MDSNVWLVRPSPNNVNRLAEFRSQKIVAIGWPKLGDLHGKSREEIKTCLTQPEHALSGHALGSAYATVDIFVNQMKRGDLLLVADGADIFFAEVCSDYIWNAAAIQDGYPHQRQVKWLQSAARTDLSMSLRSSLKVWRTIADLGKHAEEIRALSKGQTYAEPCEEETMIAVSYPLRRDFTVEFMIPKNITKTEAQRLAHYLETLYFCE